MRLDSAAGTLRARVPLLAAAALALAGTARAEPELGLRVGVALPTGDAAPDAPLSDVLSLQFPVQLDALWRAGRVAAGGYGSWAAAQAGGCVAGASCDGSSWRAGLQATWAFVDADRSRERPALEPWAGVAAGWEWATHRQRAGGETSTTWSGPELALQGGLEWRVSPRLALGPLLLVGIGRYRHLSLETPFDSDSADLEDRATHAWFHLGVRARLGLGRAAP